MTVLYKILRMFILHYVFNGGNQEVTSYIPRALSRKEINIGPRGNHSSNKGHTSMVKIFFSIVKSFLCMSFYG